MAERCNCCPHGYHIDLDFVTFAEQVASGKRAPAASRAAQLRKEERSRASPVGSLMSDSIENMMSDLEEVLGRETRRPPPTMAHSAHSTMVRSAHFESSNGYMSDSSIYRSTPISFPSGFSTVAGAPAPKPPSRGTSRGASSTPAAGQGPGYSTAIARALSEARLRPSGTESPTPRTYSPLPSREIIDPVSPTWRRRAFNSTPTTPLVQSALRDHSGLPPLAPSTPSSINEMHSMRRSRESESSSTSRNRYFSASPKMPRRLVTATPIEEPDFASPPARPTALYAVARTPGAAEPLAAITPYSAALTAAARCDTADASCWTGPATPAKPCLECAQLRALVEQMNERLSRESVDCSVQTVRKLFKESGISTETAATVDSATDPVVRQLTDAVAATDAALTTETEIQTDVIVEQEKKMEERGTNTLEIQPLDCVDRGSDACPTHTSAAESQTDLDPRECTEEEMIDSSWLIPVEKKIIGKDENENGLTPPQQSPVSDPPPDYDMVDDVELDDVIEQADECDYKVVDSDARTESPEDITIEQEVDHKELSIDNVDHDKIEKSIDNDKSETKEEDKNIEDMMVEDETNAIVPEVVEESRRLGEEEVQSLKKLLVSEEPKAFVRGGVFRSLRARTSKSSDEEDVQLYHSSSTETSTPTEKPTEALKGKIALKKPIATDTASLPPVSSIPEPQAARIPRPKFSKYAPDHLVEAETKDEEEEAADRLTPLRSELRSLGSWPSTGATAAPISVPPPVIEEETCSDSESDGSEGSYETNEDGPFEPSEPLLDAIKTLDRHVTGAKQKQEAVEWAMKLVQHEWLKTAASRSSKVDRIAAFISCVKEQSENLHEFIINIDDANANTALHYAVSNGNLAIASLLLDYQTNVDCANRAGYSPLMLAALVDIKDPAEVNIIHRLFRAGDVNARAQPHGQTALMLAVSHGKLETAKLLIECGADVNVQDEEGSTALMCAAEHGHKPLVSLLLSHPAIDASLDDCDSSTALSIAVENGHKEIGLMIYAHQKRHNETSI